MCALELEGRANLVEKFGTIITSGHPHQPFALSLIYLPCRKKGPRDKKNWKLIIKQTGLMARRPEMTRLSTEISIWTEPREFVSHFSLSNKNSWIVARSGHRFFTSGVGNREMPVADDTRGRDGSVKFNHHFPPCFKANGKMSQARSQANGKISLRENKVLYRPDLENEILLRYPYNESLRRHRYIFL